MTDQELVDAAAKKGERTAKLRRRFKKARLALKAEPSAWGSTESEDKTEYDRARELLLRAIK